jgi:hypothetical protein
MKVDAHEYTTEAKDLSIEVCRNMWIMNYGDGWIDESILLEQEPLMWEIGNRLWWADILETDGMQPNGRYRCKS